MKNIDKFINSKIDSLKDGLYYNSYQPSLDHITRLKIQNQLSRPLRFQIDFSLPATSLIRCFKICF